MFSQWDYSFLAGAARSEWPIDIYIYITRSIQSKNIRPQFQQDFSLTTDATGVFNSTLTRDIAVPVNAPIDQLDNIPLSDVQGFKEVASPWYTDQVLPFDITLAAANEYGAAASAKLFGVEILNEGFGTSIDDSVLEQQATFVERSSKNLASYLVTSVAENQTGVVRLPVLNNV